MEIERHYHYKKEEVPLKPKTKRLIEKSYRDMLPKKPKPQDEIEEILAESPDFAALTKEELKKEKEFIKEELAENKAETNQDLKREPKKINGD